MKQLSLEQINRLNDMLSSKDPEMQDLALVMMEMNKEEGSRSFRIGIACCQLASDAYQLGKKHAEEYLRLRDNQRKRKRHEEQDFSSIIAGSGNSSSTERAGTENI